MALFKTLKPESNEAVGVMESLNGSMTNFALILWSAQLLYQLLGLNDSNLRELASPYVFKSDN